MFLLCCLLHRETLLKLGSQAHRSVGWEAVTERTIAPVTSNKEIKKPTKALNIRL